MMDSATRFSHDFSRIPICSPTAGVIQTKLTINKPGDRYEQEADYISEQVMRMTDLGSPQADDEDKTKNSLMRKHSSQTGAHVATEAFSVPPLVQDTLNGGGGQPLDTTTRAFMEQRFDYDFSQVRVHTDERAAASAHSVNARAYTVGQHVVFGEGQYTPNTSQGQHLLAHELTHVVQQLGGSLTKPTRDRSEDRHEQKASMPADTFMPKAEISVSKSFDLYSDQHTSRLPVRISPISPAIQRAETDTGAYGCKDLPDSAAELNNKINATLLKAREQLKGHLDPEALIMIVFTELSKGGPSGLTRIEYWANTNLKTRGGGSSDKRTGKDVTKGTKYAEVPESFRYIKKYLAPAVTLNGICVGTDKIRHMFEEGFHYFVIATPSKILGMGKGEAYAKAWGEWSEGVLSEETKNNPKIMAWLRKMASRPTDAPLRASIQGLPQGEFGLGVMGVHSKADLEANTTGMKFYQDLLANPYLTFDIKNYITELWDEEKAGNIYDPAVYEAVKKVGRLNPRDEERCLYPGKFRSISIQPIFFKDSQNDPHPTGQSYQVRLATSRHIWEKLGIQLIPLTPITIVSSYLKSAGKSEKELEAIFVAHHAGSRTIQVFFFANPLKADNGGYTSSKGDQIAISDLGKSKTLLAHELGHAFGLGHHDTKTPTVMTPSHSIDDDDPETVTYKEYQVIDKNLPATSVEACLHPDSAQ